MQCRMRVAVNRAPWQAATTAGVDCTVDTCIADCAYFLKEDPRLMFTANSPLPDGW